MKISPCFWVLLLAFHTAKVLQRAINRVGVCVVPPTDL
jgi:hypothetical protein